MPRKAKAGKTKLKTHKATSKRFRLTGSGKVMRTKGGKSHLRRRTSKRTKEQLSEMHEVKGSGIISALSDLRPTWNKASRPISYPIFYLRLSGVHNWQMLTACRR